MTTGRLADHNDCATARPTAIRCVDQPIRMLVTRSVAVGQTWPCYVKKAYVRT